METRADANQLTPELVQHAVKLQAAVEATGVDKTLIELLKIRVSQINGCA
jgi:alkylhydroperoxidase family enzyme